MRPLALAYHAIGTRAVREDPHGLFVSLGAAAAATWPGCSGAGYSLVTFGELVARGEDGLCALTFDDGFESCAALVGPRRSGDAVRRLRAGSAAGIRMCADATMLSEDGVRRLHAAGVEIGAHTATHPDLTTLGFDAARDELERPPASPWSRCSRRRSPPPRIPTAARRRRPWRVRLGGLQRGLPDERVRLAVDAARLPARGHGRPGVAARAAAEGGGALRAADRQRPAARGVRRAGRQLRGPR